MALIPIHISPLPKRRLAVRFVPAVFGLVTLGCSGAAVAQGPSAGEPAFAESHPLGRPSGEQIAGWIEQLGDDSFTARQAAAEQLLASGHVAREALLDWVDAPDPEIRAAARRLVSLIEQTEFDRRLAEFAADVDGTRGVTLPGWPEFRALVGNDEAVRKLFVEMQRCEAALLADVFRDRGGKSETNWQERIAEIQQEQRIGRQRNMPPPLASCVTMLFLGCLDDFSGAEQIANHVAELAAQPPIREAILSEDASNTIIRRLLLAWINDGPVESHRALQSRLQLITVYKLAEAMPLLTAVVQGQPPYITANVGNRAMAVLAIGRFGSAENIDDLEPLLADATIWTSTNHLGKARTIQLRDVALATMLHLAGQPLQDYGFDNVQRNPQLLFNPQSLAMADDETRTAAIARWQAWRAEHQGEGN